MKIEDIAKQMCPECSFTLIEGKCEKCGFIIEARRWPYEEFHGWEHFAEHLDEQGIFAKVSSFKIYEDELSPEGEAVLIVGKPIPIPFDPETADSSGVVGDGWMIFQGDFGWEGAQDLWFWSDDGTDVQLKSLTNGVEYAGRYLKKSGKFRVDTRTEPGRAEAEVEPLTPDEQERQDRAAQQRLEEPPGRV